MVLHVFGETKGVSEALRDMTKLIKDGEKAEQMLRDVGWTPEDVKSAAQKRRDRVNQIIAANS